jgi:hypothetical protein
MLYNVNVDKNIHMDKNIFTLQRIGRMAMLAMTSLMTLYVVVLGFAEPSRSMAASSPQTVGVALIVSTSISNNCSPATVSLGTIIRTGDSSTNTGGCGALGYCANRATACTVVTNSNLGYTLSWLVQSGTGSLGSRTGTGYLNAFTSLANRIAPLGTGSTTMNTQPIAMTAGAGTVNNDARWAGRLSSTSTTPGGSGQSWGTDGTSDAWLRVATGSSVNIAKRNTQTTGGGDTENIGFRAILHGTVIVPSDTYKAYVVMTATDN